MAEIFSTDTVQFSGQLRTFSASNLNELFGDQKITFSTTIITHSGQKVTA